MVMGNKLIIKIKRLLKRAKAPKFLNKFGPKTYELWQHALALLIKEMCQMSYRRIVTFFKLIGIDIGSKSTLCYQAKRIPIGIWQKILKITLPKDFQIVAIDGSGLSCTNPSWHYAKRIGLEGPGRGFFKISICVDTVSKKILSLRLRNSHASDIKDVKYLIRQLPKNPEIMLADKGYDAEWLHRWLADLGCKAIIPTRKSAKRGYFRRKMRDFFPKKQYAQRNIVEGIFSALKRKYGGSVSSLKKRAATTQIYCRAILHNVMIYVLIDLGQRPRNRRIQKS